MDNKTIALISALLVLGVAIYGMATGNLPGMDSTGNESDNGTADTFGGGGTTTTSGGGGGGGSDGGGDDGGNNASENATGNMTGNMTDPEPEPLPVVCEEQGGDITAEDVDSVTSGGGPIFDPLLAESMVHDALNELRATHSEGIVDPFKCDPGLREIARNHSKLKLIEEGRRGGEYITSDVEESQELIRSLGGELELQDNIGEVTQDDIEVKDTAERYAGVCENPSEVYGEWLWQRSIDSFDSGDFSGDAAEGGDDQEMRRIDDHGDFRRDVRKHWFDSNLDTLTDKTKTRQGIGIAIDRRTGDVVVTQVVCGPRDLNQTQGPSR